MSTKKIKTELEHYRDLERTVSLLIYKSSLITSIDDYNMKLLIDEITRIIIDIGKLRKEKARLLELKKESKPKRFGIRRV